jgi:hypothetical protein
MANQTIVSNVITYEPVGKVRSLSGIFGFRKYRNLSSDLNIFIKNYLAERRSHFNEIVGNAYDISGEFQKFDFIVADEFAEYLEDEENEKIGTGISSQLVKFRSNAKVQILYVKEKSLIYFETKFTFVVVKPGCFRSQSDILYQGGKHYMLDEIYFNKISTVSTQTIETQKQFLNERCWGLKNEVTTRPQSEETIIIRAGENFPLSADSNQAQELRDARKLINAKIASVN